MLSYMTVSTSYYPHCPEVAEPEDEPLIAHDASERSTRDSVGCGNQADQEASAHTPGDDSSSRIESSQNGSSSLLEFEVPDESNNQSLDEYPSPIPVTSRDYYEQQQQLQLYQ